MKHFIIFLPILFACSAFGQMGIGTGAAVPNSAVAELEVASTNKGVLFPRMTSVQMNAISGAVDGLLVYNITDSAFFYYKSGKWIPANFRHRTVLQDTNGDTRVEVERTSNDDVIRFSANADANASVVGATDDVASLSSTGFNLLSESFTYKIQSSQAIKKKGTNIFIGNGGTSLTGTSNTALGFNALSSIIGGSNNVAVGNSAGYYLTTASKSVFVGHSAAKGVSANKLTGDANTVIGYNSGALLQKTAQYNTIIGYNSGIALTQSRHNILIGANIGNDFATDSNIVIGLGQSVSNITKNGQCNIGNVIGSDSIYYLNGNIKFANAYTFPETIGSAGQTLVLGDNGALKWGDKNVTGNANMTVTGAATNLQPFSKIFGSESNNYGDVYFVPTVAMAKGEVSKISTFIVNPNGVTTARLGLYYISGGDMVAVSVGGQKFEGGVAITESNSTITYDYYAATGQKLAVNIGDTYYIAVYASDASNNATFLKKSDQDFKSKKYNVSTGRTGYIIPATYSYASLSDDPLIWVRAH